MGNKWKRKTRSRDIRVKSTDFGENITGTAIVISVSKFHYRITKEKINGYYLEN